MITCTGGSDIQCEEKVTWDGTNFSIDGNFFATQKSFDIVHPTKEGLRLRYGVLEGPENGVYLRGNTNTNVIELPDYWTGLVHEDSITVQLTPIGNGTQHFILKVEDNKVYIDSTTGDINVSYLIFGERKDVDKIIVEYQRVNS
jgi:fructose/tagatose bisphosphate aldolase